MIGIEVGEEQGEAAEAIARVGISGACEDHGAVGHVRHRDPVFCPDITQPSSFRRARVLIRELSEPASASVTAKQSRVVPAQMVGR